MKNITTILTATVVLVFAACNQNTEAVSTETEVAIIAAPVLNIDSLVVDIDAKRAAIEANLMEPQIVLTTDYRAKLKQKWEKIHFYRSGDQVVRIKTYPYASISKRTEEFYLENGKVILAVIEDNGDGDKGKALDQLDKVYYFNNDKMIKELKKSEKEYSIKDSDAEELLEEVAEYLEIGNSKQ